MRKANPKIAILGTPCCRKGRRTFVCFKSYPYAEVY